MEIENYLGGCFEIELFGPCYKVFRIPSPAENLYFPIIGIVALYVCDYPIFQNLIFLARNCASAEKAVVKIDRNCDQYIQWCQLQEQIAGLEITKYDSQRKRSCQTTH